MPNAEKLEKVAALKDRIEGSNALLLAEFRGLSVHDATELRRSLADQARFAVVKNTLMQRAAGDAGISDLDPFLEGPTAVAFVEGDVVAAAKRVVDAAKKFPALVLKGGYLDGKVLDAAEAQALATLESREVMLSKIAGLLKGEMTRAASMFQALQGRFLSLLEAYKDKLEPDEVPAAGDAESASAGAPSPLAADGSGDASASEGTAGDDEAPAPADSAPSEEANAELAPEGEEGLAEEAAEPEDASSEVAGLPGRGEP